MLNRSNVIFEDLDLSYLELFSLQEPLSYRYEDLGKVPSSGSSLCADVSFMGCLG